MKKLTRITLSFFACILISNILFAQTSLQGTVTDPDGIGVISAFVVLKKGSNEVKTVPSDFDGNYLFSQIKPGVYSIEVSNIEFVTQRIDSIVIVDGETKVVNICMSEINVMDEVMITGYRKPLIDFDNTSSSQTVTAKGIRNLGVKSVNAVVSRLSGLSTQRGSNAGSIRGSRSNATNYYVDGLRVTGLVPSREQYDNFEDNPFLTSTNEPLSTLSIDVDRASYSNVRRFINQGQMPPQDAVRVEEMINYFQYEYDAPKKDAARPFNTHIAIGNCPWNPKHQLMRVALQGERIESEDIPATNFVFLIDVSGSMNSADKLPLLKSSLKLLVDQLRPIDRVAMTVYAGAAGTVLESTPGTNKAAILDAIEKLESGGSTAGAAGINLAYQVAEENFIEDGNNRIVLATDGDFNVGVSGDDALVKLIEEKRKNGIFLSVMGFGQGNYQESKMQKIANHGNGNHSYIDNMSEAKKVLMDEFGGTLYTIAKDVKIQIEFNPAVISGYRLVGYENRILAAEDFNDDTKDAGEMGAGHTVTVLYELIPAGVESEFSEQIDKLKYQKIEAAITNSEELATIKYRFKRPTERKSSKSEEVIANQILDYDDWDEDFLWAATVAEFGMLLRNSTYKNAASYDHVLEQAKKLNANCNDLYRTEFIQLVEIAKSLAHTETGEE